MFCKKAIILDISNQPLQAKEALIEAKNIANEIDNGQSELNQIIELFPQILTFISPRVYHEI